MADEEAEVERRLREDVLELRGALQRLEEGALRRTGESPAQSSAVYCQEFCRILVEYAGRWSIEEDPLPLVDVYIVALLSYAQASSYLSLQCENVPVVVERLSLSFVELLLSLKKNVPEALWKQFKLSVQFSSTKLQENGISQLSALVALCQYDGVWNSQVLRGLLSREELQNEQVEKFLLQEGPVLLEMRVKQLMKDNHAEKAAVLAEACSRCPAFQEKSSFKQLYLVCLCATSERDQLMEELSKEDCRDALEMICNLESDGDEKAAFSLCTAFLTRQLLQGDTYCAWELTLFWSKLLKRLEPSEQGFLDRCRQMSLLSKTVYHILFLIKVVQSEIDSTGLPVCIEMCIRALRMESEDGNTKASVCKTISCLLPTDLEVKRACQLTEFLLEPTVDAYYAVETLYNEPDQKVEEEEMPISNSLRCELLLVLKTHWPFDPEFWDWRTLKRQCLALMGEEASIVSSIDLLNDNEEPEKEEDSFSHDYFNNTAENFMSGTCELSDMKERRQRNRELKKLREKGFISSKFRNWQAYMQYCVLCDKEFLGHRIVRHAQIHFCNGVYRCPICAQSFSLKDVFLPHVKSHVKQSCKERLSALKSSKRLPSPEVLIPDTAALKAKTGKDFKQKFTSQLINGMLMPHVEIRLSRCDMETADTYVCPVGKCRRSFKFLKNLVAHVKTHGNNEEAKTFLEMRRKKVVCQYCRRRFVSVTHLNDHLQVHRGTKPYICVQLNCKASFQSNTELHEHKRTHPVFRAKCMFPNCGKIFSEAYKLYDHEEFHYERFTCKFVDCGRVFQSLKLLDLHQEKHSNIKKESTSGANPQNMQHASLIKQMLTNSSQPGSSQGKQNSESGTHHQCEQLAVTTEGLHKPDIPADPQMVSTSRSQNLNNSVIQPVNPELSDSNKHRGGFDGHSFESKSQPHSNTTNAQIFNRNDQQESGCSSRLSSVSSLYTPMEPVSQPLAPVKPEKTLTIGSGADPPAGQKKRYHCAFETCKRLYGAQRSVTKHMRAVHPDFYEQWKHVRTPIKVTYGLVPEVPFVRYDCSGDQQSSRLPVGVPRQNIIQLPPYTSTTSQNCTPVYSNSAEAQNASAILENVLPPIGISQLGSDNGPKCHSASGDEQIQHSFSSNICPSDMQGMPQVDCGIHPLLNTPSLSMMVVTRPTETLQASSLGGGSHSVLPSYMTGAKEPSQHLHNLETQSSRTSSSDEIQSMQKHAEGNIPNPDSARQSNILGFCKNDPNGHKQAKRHRSKWPAIVRDGKFVCCLCFKEFNSPKSLGGHLSRGAACKPDKTDLNSELPKSFLDFLHSDQTIPNQPSLYLSQNAVFPQPVINGSTSTNLNLPPENLLAYGNGEPGIIREICTETSMSDYYNQTSNPVPCAPHNAAECSPGNSVIQRTETLPANHQGPSFPAPRYSQPGVKTYDGSQFPNPAHPHIFSATLPFSPGSTKQREQYNSGGHNSETTVETKDANLSSAFSGCGTAETQRKMHEQDVKRRLRQQILGDEFKHRGKTGKITDANSSLNNPVSFGSLRNPPRNYEVEQALSDKNSNSLTPETSPEAKDPLNTPSFMGFRESSAIRSEALSPDVVMTQEADLEPSDSSGSQQQCITEIQSAFEKLDLVTEVSAQISLPVKPNPNTVIRKAGPTHRKVLFPTHLKPFACDNKSCTVRFMTGDALWKHLSKIHNYTVDMVNQAKKRYGQYAPFKCQKCNKCFTRNTSLRIHYQSTHKLSATEIEELNLKRRQATAAAVVALKVGPTSNDKHQDEGHWTPFQHLQPAGPQSQANECSLNDQAASTEIPKKTKVRKPSSEYRKSPFRPYRCFHQGCEAAFTIQHNLILHYRVVHQLAFSALAVSKDPAENNGLQVKSQDEVDPKEQVFKMSEFRCQVKDCSRVFQEVPNLVQHYLRLHCFSVDNIGTLLSNIKPQTFICGYQGCPAIFTTACRYIGHVREQHNDMLAQPEQLNGSFRCEFEGCDRTYATKSNMVRHCMKKHGKLYRAQLKKEQIKRAKMKRSSGALRYQITKTLNGKENIESNRKIWKKGDLKQKKGSKANIWTTYGKLSLKTKVEASALCTKKFPLQYPCMIKGCESVMKSERNILKHYLGHGLSEKFLELQRSHFIFCKKAPRLKWSSLRSDESKSDSELSSSELTSETSPDEDDSGGSKPVLRRRSSAKIPIVLFDSKLANIEGFSRSVVVKRKRGRPRKFPVGGKPKKIPRTKLDIDCSGEEESDFSPPAVMQEEVTKLSTPLATFKPMGFEMSFLKFLEQSNKSDRLPGKTGEAEGLRKSSLQGREDICVRFRNHKKLKSLNKVKIIIDGAFSGVTKLMLTQLQDMRPTVVLRGK